MNGEGAAQPCETAGAVESLSGLEQSQFLFGQSSEHFDDASAFDLHSEVNLSALAGSSHGCDADGYQDPEIELEEPQTAEQTARFATIIDDHCLSVPPVMNVKLPWETGVMEAIFGTSLELPELPIPRLEPIEIAVDTIRGLSGSAMSQPCSQPGRGVYLRVIDFGARLSDDEIDQKSWNQALERWYIIFSSGRAAWPRGYDLDDILKRYDTMSLKRVFGNRSASTVLKRGNSIIRFMKWHRETHFSLCPFPIY